MEYKYKYNNEVERDFIIKQNLHLTLIGQQNLGIGNYLIFTDEKIECDPSIEEIVQEQGNKISILEAENKTLKQELSITQDAVNELIFNSLNM